MESDRGRGSSASTYSTGRDGTQDGRYSSSSSSSSSSRATVVIRRDSYGQGGQGQGQGLVVTNAASRESSAGSSMGGGDTQMSER